MFTISDLTVLIPVFIVVVGVIFCAITEYKEKL